MQTVKKQKVIEVGGIKFTPLFEGLMPKITEEEYHRLRNDIEANNVLVPIVVDEKKGVIDGLNRIRAVSELGYKTVPFHIHPNLSKKEKRELALKLNALRRHWTKEERLDLAVALRKDGYTVLDPFNGAGTTGLACQQLGRNYLGIELSPTYCQISVNRWKNVKKVA